MRGFFHLAVSILFILAISACQEDAGTLTLPSELDKDYSLAFMDTTKVVTSTILLDSLPTSNVGSLLFGKYQDPKLGLVEAKAYFQIAPEEFWSIDNDATYESIALIMQSSGYYYGDTTKAQTIEVHRIIDDFKTYNLDPFWISQNLYSYFTTSKDKLYNTSKIKIDSINLLGSTTYKIPLVIKDSITVKLDDNLGLAWFEMAKEGSLEINYASRFLQSFKGISITATEEANITSVVPQIQINDGGVNVLKRSKIRITYHEIENGVLTTRFHDFPFFGGFYDPGAPYNPENNFTKIKSVRTGVLGNLTNTNPKISSELTDNETYVQAGVGLATKVEFPSLKNILDLPGFLKINSAKLIIEPVKNSFNETYYLPSELTLFYGKLNYPSQQVFADYSSKTKQSAFISIDPEKNITSGYTFSLTQLVQSLIQNNETDMKDVSLIVTNPITNIGASVSRVVLGNGSRSDYRARLEIYYLKQNK